MPDRLWQLPQTEVPREIITARGKSPRNNARPLTQNDTMAMGKKPSSRRQRGMWVATQKLPRSPGHPFYERLNQVLEKAGFDAVVEALCARFYADGIGRPSLRPGRYFRMLLVGYFEGLNSERAIAWRVADSMSLRAFLDLDPEETPPNHSTLSRTRRRIGVETHGEVFTWVLKQLAQAGLVRGKTIGIDATTLEANAAMRSLVRRDTGEDYETFVKGLAAASGVPTPTREELVRFDRKRKKKTSNREWVNPPVLELHDLRVRVVRIHPFPVARLLLALPVEPNQLLPGRCRDSRGRRGRRLQRQRSELVERPFAHQFTTGGLRRIFVRGHANVRKRLLIQVCGFNLGLLMRHLTGVGTPRSLQGRVLARLFLLLGAKMGRWIGWNRLWEPFWASIGLDPLFGASRTHH